MKTTELTRDERHAKMNDIVCALLDHGAMSVERLSGQIGLDIPTVSGMLTFLMYEGITECRRGFWTYTDALEYAAE